MESAQEHSDVIGGSSARRRLHCAGSYRLTRLIPNAVRAAGSVYADEGTACHQVVEAVLDRDEDPEWYRGRTFTPNALHAIDARLHIAKLTGPVEMDDDLMLAVWAAIDMFDELDKLYADEGGLEYMIEARCAFPGVDGGFGTTDVGARTRKRSVIIDWKFGVGVQVSVVYHDPDPVTGQLVADVNEQLLFYAASMRNQHPHMFETDPDWPIELYVAQPRSRELSPGDPIFTHVTVTNADLDAFVARVHAAIPKMYEPDAPTTPGDWCKFCPAMAICPSKLVPVDALVSVFDKLESLGKNKAGVEKLRLPHPPPNTNWNDLYGNLLDMAYAVEPVVAAIIEAGHVYIDAGNEIDGWKLVDKRKTERWLDEEGALRHVVGTGVSIDACMTEPKLKSPAQLGYLMEPLMDGATKKAREAEARAQLAAFSEKTSSGTTLARADDKRPAVLSAPALLQQLTGKLQSLRGE